MAQKVIIDTDIGTYYDDALAVSVGCQSPELELLGVTTVYGDTHLRSRIARKVLDVNGRPDVPVARGVGQPLQGNYLMFGFEGEGILEEGDGDLAYLKEPAPNFIIRNIMENPGEVTVVTLGAVSNMAVAYVMEPAIRENIKELIMMAGVIVPIVDEKGIRRSPVEEYNFNNDPVAAQIVCNSGMPMVLCPIDVTLKVPLRDDQLATINASDRPVAQMVSRILAVWPPQERQIYLSVGIPTEHTGLWLHDPLAVTLAHDKSYCEMTRLHISAEFAPTPIDRDLIVRNDILRTIPRKLEPNMDACVDVDADRFTAFFTERIAKGAWGAARAAPGCGSAALSVPPQRHTGPALTLLRRWLSVGAVSSTRRVKPRFLNGALHPMTVWVRATGRRAPRGSWPEPRAFAPGSATPNILVGSHVCSRTVWAQMWE